MRARGPSHTKNPDSTCGRIGISTAYVYPLGNRPLRRCAWYSPDQVSWLPGCLLTRLPMVTHSGLSSFRARYSCGNSDRAVLPFSEEDSLAIWCYLRRKASLVSSVSRQHRSRVILCRMQCQTHSQYMMIATPMRATHLLMRSCLSAEEATALPFSVDGHGHGLPCLRLDQACPHVYSFLSVRWSGRRPRADAVEGSVDHANVVDP